MRGAGQVVLFRFPQANLTRGKLRPALLIAAFPGPYDDWLMCMISSQLHHYVKGFDEIIGEDDVDFCGSGLKTASLICTGRLAVVEGRMLLGSIGEIAPERLSHIKTRLADWVTRN